MSSLKPSTKQLKAFKLAVENGGNITQAMIDSGYRPATVHNPDNLTDSDGWSILLETFIPDETLIIKLDEGLNADKPISAQILIQGNKTVVTKENEGQVVVPDYGVRHKYLETALKLKQKLMTKFDITSGGNPIPILGGASIEK